MTSDEEIRSLRQALESIHDFAHSLHRHPEYEFQCHYPAGSAMEEIAQAAEKALNGGLEL
jgi:hypothetical protein